MEPPGAIMPASHSIDNLFSSLLDRRKSQGTLRNLSKPARQLVDFSSNDYLSLSRNSHLRKEYFRQLQQGAESGDFSLGSGGSRLLDGNSNLAEELECTLAQFYGAEASLLFNSGFDANTGLFAAAPQPGDVIVYDELIHASVHSGARLSRAKPRIPFRHNHVWDTKPSCHDDAVRSEESSSSTTPGTTIRGLASVLSDLVGGEDGDALSDGRSHVFVAVEAIYSMDGDVAPLREIVECVEHYLPLGNGHVVVDEAHSTGIMGEKGRGLVAHLGLEDRIWARVHTFGKAMGCSGAIVLCSSITRKYLLNYARTFIYTTAMNYPSLVSIAVTHRFLGSGQADPFRQKLIDLVQHTTKSLASRCDPSLLQLKQQQQQQQQQQQHASSHLSPIIPLFTTRARDLAAYCQSRGYMVRPIVAPTVPVGTDRVRICLHAGNTLDECEGLVRVIGEWARHQGERSSEVSAVQLKDAQRADRKGLRMSKVGGARL